MQDEMDRLENPFEEDPFAEQRIENAIIPSPEPLRDPGILLTPIVYWNRLPIDVDPYEWEEEYNLLNDLQGGTMYGRI